MQNEEWKKIPGFDDYMISSAGKVLNLVTEQVINGSVVTGGAISVQLYDAKERHARSIKRMVAHAFLEKPPYTPNEPYADTVIVKDGDEHNLDVSNLAWRTRGFAWQYKRQLTNIPSHYYTLGPYQNKVTKLQYNNMYEIAVTHGVLFVDIKRYLGKMIPHIPPVSLEIVRLGREVPYPYDPNI